MRLNRLKCDHRHKKPKWDLQVLYAIFASVQRSVSNCNFQHIIFNFAS